MIDLMWYESDTQLNSHPFVQLMLNKRIEIGKKLEKLELRGMKTSLETVRTSDVFSREDKIALEVHLLLQEVHFKIDRIQQCHTMLDFYPEDIRTAWFTTMTKGEYIEHIMELYATHSVGLVDRVLILYNYIFDLKLKRRDRMVLNITRKLSCKPNQLSYLLGVLNNINVFDFYRAAVIRQQGSHNFDQSAFSGAIRTK